MSDTVIPGSVGLIMDGNGRWAEGRGLTRKEGHTAGIYKMISIVAHAFSRGVNNMICYGLSTENLERPKEEIEHIYNLMIEVFDLFVSTFSKIKACVKYIGNTAALPQAVRESMERSQKALGAFAPYGKTIYIAVAYGSRREITEAVNYAVSRGERVTEESFLSMLGMPLEPELIIRTGGEHRLSNFLLYQASYSELYFSDKLFPDFTEEDFNEALLWFRGRKRRFGLV